MTGREIDLQMARREGYLRRAAEMCDHTFGDRQPCEDRAKMCAKRAYPITRTVPREVVVGTARYRLVDGVLFLHMHVGHLQGWSKSQTTIEDYVAIASLQDSPTVEVASDEV